MTETAVASKQEAVLTITRKSVKEALDARFINTTSVAEVLKIGYDAKRNVILWGPGGHGKSEMTEEFFKSMNIEPYVKALGEGSTEDDLLGGVNIAKFNETGTIEYNVESSFMNYEYVVFEELLDCPANVLLKLKDILTSGYLRNGSQQFKIKTKFIVCLTNRSRDEVSEDLSIMALMERFPLELEVKWASYDENAYNTLYRKVFGFNENKLISSGLSLVVVAAIASNNDTKKIISPRTMVYAGQIIQNSTNIDKLPISKALDDLKYIPGFTHKGITEAKEQIKHMEQINKDREILEHNEKTIDEYRTPAKIKAFAALSSKDQLAHLTKAKNHYNELRVSQCADEVITYKKEIVTKLEDLIKTLEKIHEGNIKK